MEFENELDRIIRGFRAQGRDQQPVTVTIVQLMHAFGKPEDEQHARPMVLFAVALHRLLRAELPPLITTETETETETETNA